MSKKPKRKYRLSDHAKDAARAPRGRRRDPITTFARFSNFMAIGMIAAAYYLNNDDLNRIAPGKPPITFDQFPDTLQKIAIAAVHMRGAAFTLAGLSLIVTLIWYRTRYRTRRLRIVAYAPLAALVVIGLHAAALGYLKSTNNGLLHIQSSDTIRLPSLDLSDMATTGPAATSAASAPAAIVPLTYTKISGISVPEGRRDQWTFLFAGDTLFISPILFAWLMSLGVHYLPKPESE